MKIEELKDLKGEWRLFVNGMQQGQSKENYTYNEMIEFINHENVSIINTSCEYIIRFHHLTTEFEFRNNHWARENNYA
jgi:hypothetical protein